MTQLLEVISTLNIEKSAQGVAAASRQHDSSMKAFLFTESSGAGSTGETFKDHECSLLNRLVPIAIGIGSGVYPAEMRDIKAKEQK